MKRRRTKNYRVDRVFPDVGRINLVSGASTLAEHRKRDALLSELSDTGRLEILLAIKRRELSINEVFSAHRARRLGFTVGDVVLKRPLWSALEEWLPTSAKAEATRKRSRVSVNWLKKHAGLSDCATLADLAVVNWAGLNNRGLVGPTGWNHVRRMVSRFLTMSLRNNKHHPFRIEVMNIFPSEKDPPGRVPDLTRDGFWGIMKHVAEPLRPCYVALVLTGMRPGEYLRCAEADLMPDIRALRVPGTKTSASADVIPLDDESFEWVRLAIPCPVSHGVLAERWKKACRAAGHIGLRLHDLRHCHAQWLANAGVPEARIQQALRHRTPSMTRRYTTQRDKGENARTFAQVMFDSPERPAVYPASVLDGDEEKVG